MSIILVLLQKLMFNQSCICKLNAAPNVFLTIFAAQKQNNMKNTIILFTLLIGINFCYSQECFTPYNHYEIQLNEGDCSNYLFFIPNKYTPTLTVKINFHFFRNDDGSGDYQPADSLKIKQMIQWLNAIYKYLAPPTIAPATLTDTIYDSKIQFILKGVYYHNNSQYYSGDSDVHYYSNLFITDYGINPSSEINVFFHYNSHYPYSGGCGSSNQVTLHNQVIENYATAQLLAHELGHSLGLDHTWYGQFDDTFFPDNNKAFVQCNKIDISNNIMGYNMCRNYLSPKQIGYMHKCLTTNIDRRIFLETDISYPNLQIDSSFTLNHAIFFNGNVIIESGYTLNITCQVYCSQNANIIVRPGGKLIVDGGELTSAGNAMWKGVIIEGNADSSRLERCQGNIILKNGATISNALCGVKVLGGGIIKATDAYFTNNSQSIEMYEYNHPQVVSSYLPLRKTYFCNCVFNVNNNAFFANSESFTHVSLMGIQDAAFVSCSFTDTRSNQYLNLLGVGIAAFSSSLDLDDNHINILTPARNLFSGLGTGILVQNSYENTSRVQCCHFINNSTGIHAINADYLVCRDNVFEIEHPIYGIAGNTHGIILEESSQYTVMNNFFSGIGTYSIGISFYNSGIHNNLVKNNTFENLYVGCYVDGCNGGSIYESVFEMKGLTFRCNKYLNQSLNDIYINSNATIHPFQGALWKAAGNYFTTSMNIVNMGTELIQYYYDMNETGHLPNHTERVRLLSTNGNDCGYYGYNDWYSLVDNIPIDVLEYQFVTGNDQYQIIANTYISSYGNQIPTIFGGTQASALADLLNAQWNLTEICNAAIYKITSDSVFDEFLYEIWLERAETVGSNYALMENYFHYNATAYNSYRNSLLSRTANTAETTNLIRLYDLRHAVSNSDLGWKNMDSNSVNVLRHIAQNRNRAGMIAKSVLSTFYGETYRYDSLHPLFPVISFDNNRNGFIQKQFDEQHPKWFPEDAEWIYMRPSPSGPEVEAVPFYVKGDTVINEKKCVMTNISTYFLGGKGLCFYEENDSVFYYNETTESFQILYDFSLQAGDSYVICPSDRFINDSLFVFIDSVTSVWVNGVSLRVQYVHTQSVSHTERPNFWQIGDMNKAVIYETIGSLNFFIPQEDGWNDDFFSHLCQYSGNSIYYKQNPDENCDTKSRITEADNIGCLHICPNPASKYVDVSISEETSGKENEWTVVDVLGHVVYRNATAASEVRIPLDGMSKGLYVVRYCSGNDIRHGRFVIL